MAARTGRGETPIQHIRMDKALWEAIKARATQDGISGPEALRRLGIRYLTGDIKVGPKREWEPPVEPSVE